jgi:LTXXQ motif family protein
MKSIRRHIAGIAALAAVSVLALGIYADAWASTTDATKKQDRLAVAVPYRGETLAQLVPIPQHPGWPPSLPPDHGPFQPPPGAPPQMPTPLDPADTARPMMRPPAMAALPASRAACEEQLSRAAGMAAYFKIKLHLQPNQRDLWAKLEQAAEPALQDLQATCDRLPNDPALILNVPDAIDAAERETTARLALLRAIQGPVRALYETLSPEQRQMLQPPAPALPPL